MSHWKSGKLKLICSEEELLNGLYNLVGEDWANRWKKLRESGGIKISPKGGLTAMEYKGNTINNANIVIPHGRDSGLNYSDMAIIKKAGGEWEIVYDSPLPGSNITGSATLNSKLKMAVAKAKADKFTSSNKQHRKIHEEGDIQKTGKVKMQFISKVQQIDAQQLKQKLSV